MNAVSAFTPALPPGTHLPPGAASMAPEEAPLGCGIITAAGPLAQAVRLLRQVAVRRKTIPVLELLALEVDAEGARLTADNLDMRLSLRLPAEETDQPFAALLPASRLAALLAKLPKAAWLAIIAGPQIGLGTEWSSIMLRQDIPQQDFPAAVDAPIPTPGLLFEAAELLALLDACAPCISTEETRYYLNGIFLHAAGPEGLFYAVATDGHRLMHASGGAVGQLPYGIIIPREAVQVLRALLRPMPPAAAVLLRTTDSKAWFTGPNADWTLTTKLIDGTFPDYAKRLRQDEPAPDGPELVVLRAADLAALLVGSNVSAERSRPVKLAASRTGALLLHSRSPWGDAGVTAVPLHIARWQRAPGFEVGFQSRYVADLCRMLPGGFTLKPSAESGPAFATAEGRLGALMPMRV